MIHEYELMCHTSKLEKVQPQTFHILVISHNEFPLAKATKGWTSPRVPLVTMKTRARELRRRRGPRPGTYPGRRTSRRGKEKQEGWRRSGQLSKQLQTNNFKQTNKLSNKLTN